MARPVFTLSELVPGKIKGTKRIGANTRLDGVLNLSFKGLREQQILQKFENAINRAGSRISIDLRTALDEAIKSPIWDGGDIFDTGELMRSGIVSLSSNGITVAYSSPYAAIVHYGGYIHPYGNQNVTIYMPPRPWVEAVLFGGNGLPAFDFVSYYRDEINKEFGG